MDKNILDSLPPNGREHFEANAAVKAAIDAACGGGIPLERVAEAAFDAVIERLAATLGEHDAMEMVQRWAGEYQEIVGEGGFGPVFRDSAQE